MSQKAGRRIEGRKPVPKNVIQVAQHLARRNPKNGKLRSYRQIAAELAELGHIQPMSGRPYGAESINQMLPEGMQQKRAV